MMLNRKIYITVLLLVFTFSHSPAQRVDSLAQLMFKTTKQIKTLSYTMVKQERIDGDLKKQISFVKLQRKPLKVYTKQLSPDEGLEVLYKEGNESALVNTNGFPWFNLKLDPLGSQMTKDQHHTILDSGFDTFIDILEHLFNKYDEEILEMAQISTAVDENGRKVWKLSFNNPHYKINEYTVKANENIIDIANRKHLSEYKIIQLNSGIDDLRDVKAGETIKIPNDYASKMELLIDKKKLVPTKITVYDDQGIFERYEFRDIKIDPTFATNAFDPDNEEYGF